MLESILIGLKVQGLAVGAAGVFALPLAILSGPALVVGGLALGVAGLAVSEIEKNKSKQR